MKKILFVLTMLGGLFYTSSCSNDFDLITDWEDIPVVYALLSRSDTAHYVRLEKAFLDPNTSALQTAQIADSIYYPNATVKLVRLSNNMEYELEKVDGSLEGYPREEGVFANTPNWLYKLKFNGVTDSLREEEEYQLIVKRTEGSEPVTSTITTVSDITIASPKEDTEVAFKYGDDVTGTTTNFRWSFDQDFTIFFDAYLTFYYQENIDGEWEDRSFVWQVGSNLQPENNSTSSQSVIIEGVEFFQVVAANLRDAPDVPRRARFIDLEAIGGNQSYFDYLQVNKANSGITSSQFIPNFTNMSEGYGLFASRYSAIQRHSLTFQTRDSLEKGIYTKNLNFD